MSSPISPLEATIAALKPSVMRLLLDSRAVARMPERLPDIAGWDMQIALTRAMRQAADGAPNKDDFVRERFGITRETVERGQALRTSRSTSQVERPGPC